MLAGRFTEARRIELVETAEPSLLDEGTDEGGEIIFQPELTCLCGSDLPFFDATFEGHEIPYPQPDGKSLHEMVGTVVATNGDRWRVGERVLAVTVGQTINRRWFIVIQDRGRDGSSRSISVGGTCHLDDHRFIRLVVGILGDEFTHYSKL